MTKKRKKVEVRGVNIKITDDELTVCLSDEAKAQIGADPKLADGMKDLIAIFHQAHEGVLRGQYDSFEEAMESLTGHRPQRVEEDE